MERILSIVALVVAIGVGAYAYVTMDRQRGEVAALNTKVEALTKNLGDTQKLLTSLGTELAPLLQMIREQTGGTPPPDVDMSKLTPEKNAQFLADFEKQAGVKKTASGLLYKVIKDGPADGKHPAPGSKVGVHYRGMFIDGKVFDQSYAAAEPGAEPPVEMALEGIIPGWVEALPMMKEGDAWELVLPPSLGYGDAGRPGIPGGQVLVFKIYLLKAS